MAKREWSIYQQAIFREVAEGKGHTVVIARAGSGKTSTLVEALERVPSRLKTLAVAFNKSIEMELRDRAPGEVDVKTLHSFGLVSVRTAFGNVKIDKWKTRNFVEALVGTEPQKREFRQALEKVVSLSKGMLAATKEQVDEVIDRFELDVATDDREGFVRLVLKLLEQGAQQTDVIDFDDMIWFPFVHQLKVRTYDRIFVDETQDLNPAQLELVLKAIRKGGRVCVFGDPAQAIYGFRGADKDAVGRITERLKAKTMPLSISYRCARNIVEVAKVYVADLEAAPNALDGLVEGGVTESRMRQLVGPGDFIISRTNAPLIGLCMSFLKEGRRAAIAGRDIGAALTGLVNKAKADSVEELLQWLDEWKATECTRLASRKPPRDTQAVEDRYETVCSLCEGAKSINEVKARIETLFSDEEDRNRIVLTTTHKAKGLERKRVFLLRDTFLRRVSQEETNLLYVAVTRAKEELYMVSGIGGYAARGKKGPVAS